MAHKGLYLYVLVLFSAKLQILDDTMSHHPGSVTSSSSLDLKHRSLSPSGAFLQNSSHVEGFGNDLRQSDGRLKRKYGNLDTSDKLIEKWDDGSAVIPIKLIDDYDYDTDRMTNDTIDIDVSSPDDGGISGNWFNVTDAVLPGFEADDITSCRFYNRSIKLGLTTALAFILLDEEEYELLDHVVHLRYINVTLDARYVWKLADFYNYILLDMLTATAVLAICWSVRYSRRRQQNTGSVMFDVKLHTRSYKGHKGLYLYVMTLFSTQLQIVADTTSRHPSSVMSSSLTSGHRSSSGNWFNVTDAVLRGFEAQHEYCGAYCNGTGETQRRELDYRRPSCLTCYCDVSCGKYGDCCPRLEPNESHVTEMHAVKDTCISVCHRGVVQVVKSVCGCPTQNSSAGHDCPGTNMSDTVSDIPTRQPVLSADLSILYCNAACAYCNGESEIVQLSSRCQVNPLDDASSEDSSESGSGSLATDERSGCPSGCLNAWQVPQNYTPRHCFHVIDVSVFKGFRYVSTCNSTDDDRIVDLCGSYRFPVIFDDVVYSNLFCAICNGILPKKPSPGTPSSGILVGLHPEQFNTVDPKKCAPGNWYDVAKDVFRSVHCSRTRTLVTEWLCDFTDNTTGPDLYRLSLRLTPLNKKNGFLCKPALAQGQRSVRSLHRKAAAETRTFVLRHQDRRACIR